MANMGKVALKYRELGWSIVPVKQDKTSYVKWKDYQDRLPTKEEIIKWWETWEDANIAVITGSISNLAVIDVDEMEHKDEVDKLIPAELKFPKSITQRGAYHYFFQCPNGNLRNNVRKIKGSDLRANGGYIVLPPSRGEKGKYKWQDRPSTTPIPQVPKLYLDELNKTANSTPFNHDAKMLDDGTRDNDLFNIANTLYRGKMPEDRIFQTVLALAKQCVPPFPPNEAEEKVRSVIKRAMEREHNWKLETEQWIADTMGYFRIQDLFSELGAMSIKDKNNIRVSIHRMIKKGLVEHHKKDNGKYRRVDQRREYIDFRKASSESLFVKFPLDLHELVKLYPKNICIIAGEPNAGKTTFLLNLIKLNMHEYPITYYSSEMGDTDLRVKLELFQDVLLDDWKFKAEERSSNFADVIEPNGFNVIDYMEIHNEHYRIGEWIRDVFDKLDKGIAFIAIQKKKGASEGVGGMTTLEKARLYLTMGGSRVTIAKCKSFKDPAINPNKLFTKFKLIGGTVFKQEGDWEYE
tara:strand:- start:4616 stop:6178 length:1563 start_codon:yes stop_codon:yes gene_type:complete